MYVQLSLGIWEQIHNPNFNYGEFAIIRSNAGLNSYKISVKEWTAKQWRENNPDLKGNIRDYASINELICLSNMENINAMLIQDFLCGFWCNGLRKSGIVEIIMVIYNEYHK